VSQQDRPWRRWLTRGVICHDPLQRHLLCRATNSHDPRPDGTCRDCETVVEPDAPVCAPEVLIHAQPDEDQP